MTGRARSRRRWWWSACALLVVTSAASCADDGDDQPAETDRSSDVARYTAGGITFEYPPEVVDRVRPATSAPDDDGPRPVEVVLESALDGGGPGRILVRPVLDASGRELAALADGVIETSRSRLRLLDAAGPDAAQGSRVDFVNGAGLRHATDSGEQLYLFAGVTVGGSHLLDVEMPLSDVAATRRRQTSMLDELVRSIFVDVSAASSRAGDCKDGLELLDGERGSEPLEVQPGQTTVLTWRVRNTGTCAWSPSYSWAFTGGDPLSIVETSRIGDVDPGDTVELSVTVLAPETAGLYAAQWQLVPAGRFEALDPAATATLEVVR